MSDEDSGVMSRRNVLALTGLGLATMTGTSALGQVPALTPLDIGQVENGGVRFPNWRGEADRPSPSPPEPQPPEQRVGFALVGLGRLTLEQLLPAFSQCKRAKVVALVSGTPEKARVVCARYGIKPGAICDYDSFGRIAGNPDVQVVYVVVPNGLHRDITLRAAAAG
jgi:Oxidoreductase family, NAD-binding Rossmann fold